MPGSEEIKGYAMLLGAAALWSTTGVASRAAVMCGSDPWTNAFMRAGFGALAGGLLTLIGVRVRFLDIRMAAYGLLLSTPLYSSYLAAVERLGAGVAAVLLYTAPSIVAVSSGPLLGERVTRVRAACVALSFAGVSLIQSPASMGTGFDAAGLALGLLSGVSYAGVILASRALVTSGWTPTEVALGPLPWASLGTALVAAARGSLRVPPAGGVLWGVYLGVFTAASAYLLHASGLSRVQATPAGVVSNLEPVLAVVWGAALLGEDLNAPRVLGSALVISSAVVASAGDLLTQKPTSRYLESSQSLTFDQVDPQSPTSRRYSR